MQETPEKKARSIRSLRPEEYEFWTPPRGRAVTTGAEQAKHPLPRIPLPLHRADLAQGDPSDDAIGKGVYDYLRQFPDCPHNSDYARLLQEVYPHYLAEIGAHVVMLDRKEVDAPYVKRMISYLKILSLLDPENAALRQKMGINCYEVAVTFGELADSRKHLLDAMGHFRKAAALGAEDATTLNYLGQIDFLLGDYPGAVRRWRRVMEMVEDPQVREAFAARIERIESEQVADHPLVDDLEWIARAMELLARKEHEEARLILEHLEEQGDIAAALPSAEFFYLLAVSRSRCGDVGGAFEALEKSLEIDPGYTPAEEAKDRVLEGKDL